MEISVDKCMLNVERKVNHHIVNSSWNWSLYCTLSAVQQLFGEKCINLFYFTKCQRTYQSPN